MATKIDFADHYYEEILFQNDKVSLCLMVNRRARTMRVVDFHVGPSPTKRAFVMSLAQREGIERVYTLVEREEVASWARLGFVKEGSIPSFYKRSDAYLLGASVPRGSVSLGHLEGVKAEPGGAGQKNPRGNSKDAGDDSHQSGARFVYLDYPAVVSTARVSGPYQAIRQLAKEREGLECSAVRVQPARDMDIARSIASAERGGRVLTYLEPFSRDVERQAFICTSRGGFSLLVSVESQLCYSNAFMELVQAPRTEKEALLSTSAIGLVAERLREQGVVSTFALTAMNDLDLGAAFMNNGFKRSGFLQGHLLRSGERVDAFVWSRKLGQPEAGGLRDFEF